MAIALLSCLNTICTQNVQKYINILLKNSQNYAILNTSNPQGTSLHRKQVPGAFSGTAEADGQSETHESDYTIMERNMVMNRKLTKALCLMLSVIMLFGVIPMQAVAEAVDGRHRRSNARQATATD